MKLLVVAVGHRMPAWAEAGFVEYARRMPREARIELIALKPAARGSGQTALRVLEAEQKRIVGALPANCLRVVLDERGVLMSTAELAKRFVRWRESGRDIAFIVGGADGLAEGLKREAAFQWSLSPLTLPHALARVVLAEQLYRALTLLHNHPYHRE